MHLQITGKWSLPSYQVSRSTNKVNMSDINTPPCTESIKFHVSIQKDMSPKCPLILMIFQCVYLNVMFWFTYIYLLFRPLERSRNEARRHGWKLRSKTFRIKEDWYKKGKPVSSLRTKRFKTAGWEVSKATFQFWRHYRLRIERGSDLTQN